MISYNLQMYFLFLKNSKFMIFKERERNTDSLFHLVMPSLVVTPVCAPTGDWTCNPGASGRHSNQLSYPAGA